jgi:DNA-binding protein Fis
MKRFLIYISQSYSVPIGLPLQKEIENRGFVVKWFCDEKDTQEAFLDKQRLLQSIDDVMVYKPDVVLVATNEVPDFISGLKVQIFHGFSVGKRSDAKGHFNIRGFFDLYCTQGPSTTKPFESLAMKYKYFKVVETGWSKMDPLFPLDEKISSNLPTIMISSTFTTKLSLAKDEDVVKEIARISMLGKWYFIAVLHPKMQKEVIDKFKDMQNEYFTFYDTTDLIPLYKQADIMLSDTTSAITEFVLQKKPVVAINNTQKASHMINISKAEEIEGALEYALTRPKKIMERLEVFIAQTHPYNDGKSSERVIDTCLDFLENMQVKSKPLNLIRRYKIRKKLKYWNIFR